MTPTVRFPGAGVRSSRARGSSPWSDIGGPALDGGLGDTRVGAGLGGGLRMPATSTATVNWTWSSTIWSSSTAAVSEVSVGFNNAGWACVYQGVPYVTFAGPDQTIYIYALDGPPASGAAWRPFWSSASREGASPASWPSLACDDEAGGGDGRLLLTYIGRSGLVTVGFTGTSAASAVTTEHGSTSSAENPAAVVTDRGDAVVAYAQGGAIYLLQGSVDGAWGTATSAGAADSSALTAEFPSLAWVYRDIGDNYDDYRVLLLAYRYTTGAGDTYVTADVWYELIPAGEFEEAGLSLEPLEGSDPCAWVTADGTFLVGYTKDTSTGSEIHCAWCAEPENGWGDGSANWRRVGPLSREARDDEATNNFVHGAAADAIVLVWENGLAGSGVHDRTVDLAAGVDGVTGAFSQMANASGISSTGEQAQFPCMAVVARSSGGSDVHLFFVKGQGATTDGGFDPVSVQYRYGTLG